MAQLTWRRVGLVAIVIAALAWTVVGIMNRTGASPVPVPWTVPPLLVVASVVALRLGWRVRQYRDGKRPNLDPLEAARAAMFAQASAYSGAALSGAYFGYVIALLPDWSHEPRREIIITAFVALAAALVLCAAGWVAERWCAADDGEGKSPEASPSAA